ncbi:MAG: hypothetical protein ABL994_17790, partial [Verrucomicrobiales bacterium]
MSEQQKVFASLSGAFVAHVLLLFLVFLLLSTRVASSSLRGGNPPELEAPQEVTILMSDLMEQVTTEAPAPESRAFISTDLNRPESEAPENARFESDRNTTAATEIQPDKMLPGERVPTLDGDSPIPSLTLQNREFVEGRLNEVPSEASSPPDKLSPGAPRGGLAARPVPSSSGSRSATEFPSSDQVQKGEGSENIEGATDLPKERVGDKMSRTEGLNEGVETPLYDEPGNAPESSVQRSFVDPSGPSDSSVIDPMSAEKDRTAAPKGEENGEAESTDPVQEKVAASPEPVPGEVSAEQLANEQMASKSADDGLFSSGFSPEERQNVINGSLTRVGQNAVDAEETALGRYKKAVRDAISSTWHRYRQ